MREIFDLPTLWFIAELYLCGYAKAPEGWRSPRGFALFEGHSTERQFLECPSSYALYHTHTEC
jgi:hypothetical protein